jgi:hypothetical protein
VQQALGLFDPEVLEQELCQRRLLTALIGLAQDCPQRRPPDPVAATLVSEDVAPAAGARRLVGAVAPIGDGTGPRDDDHARRAGRARLECDERIVDHQDASLVSNPPHDPAHRRRIIGPIDAGDAKADRRRDDPRSPSASSMTRYKTFSTSSSPSACRLAPPPRASERRRPSASAR